MPFSLFRRGEQPAQAGERPRPAEPLGGPAGIAFEGYTEDWRIVGRITVPGRLSDILNRREPISIADVRWAPLDGSEPYSDAPGLQQVDPYDLIVVLTGPDSLADLDEQRRAALRVHKVTYDVNLNLGTVRVLGTVYLHPGSEPEQLLDRHTDLFVPVTKAVAFQGEVRLTDEVHDVVLINRSYLRGVEQVERGAGVSFAGPGEPPPPGPGSDGESAEARGRDEPPGPVTGSGD